MRDVTATVPPIPRPARFVPEATVIRLPEWRTRPDGGAEYYVERSARWEKIHPIYVTALQGMRDGKGFKAVYEEACGVDAALKANHVLIFLRQFYWKLHVAGNIHIPLEPPPAVFEGRYQWLQELGRGGIGVAHLCLDLETGARVVVKHAWGYRAPIETSDRSMRREGNVLRAFDHPGISRFLGEFEIEGIYHLVRGYAEGTKLGNAVPDAKERARLGIEIARIVQHIHERGYVFLDVTPGNFILRTDGHVEAIDLGICRPHVDGRAAYDASAGSRGYASPEILARSGVGIWSDVYGFGCLYQHLATGRGPKHAATREQRVTALEEAGVAGAERDLILACCTEDVATRLTLDDIVSRLAAVA